MTRLRWPLGLASLAALGAIWLLGPRYGQLQLAGDAGEFLRIVGGERSRYLAAAVADALFAACYGLLALAIARPSLASRVGTWLVVAGAAFDETENALVVANLATSSGLSNGRVDAMRIAGVAKFTSVALGAFLYLGAWVLDRRGRATSDG